MKTKKPLIAGIKNSTVKYYLKKGNVCPICNKLHKRE